MQLRFQFLILLLFALTLLSCKQANNDWSIKTLDTVSQFTLSSVSLTADKQGLLLASNRGESKILYTKDSAASWEIVKESDSHLHDMVLMESGTGIAVGNGGTVLQTEDFGQSWDQMDSSTEEPLIAVSFNETGNGIAVGRNGTVIQSNNGGKDWEKKESGFYTFFRDVSFSNNKTAVITGYGGTIIYSQDAGKTWSEQAQNFNEDLLGVHFLDSGEGFAVGRDGIILKSEDFGKTWSESNNTSNTLLDVHLLDDKNAAAVGFGGTILTTEDGGQTWKAHSADTDHGLYGVILPDSETTIAVGEYATIVSNS